MRLWEYLIVHILTFVGDDVDKSRDTLKGEGGEEGEEEKTKEEEKEKKEETEVQHANPLYQTENEKSNDTTSGENGEQE